MNFSDPTGLETYIYTSGGGSPQVVHNARQFIRAVGNASPNSISAIVARGHGGTNVADFTAAPGRNGNIVGGGGGAVFVPATRDSKGRKIGSDRTVPLKELLEDKLTDGAQIFLNGCSTGDGEWSIAQIVSDTFPNAVVRGSTNTVDEGKTLVGLYMDSNDWRYFKNGREVSPIVGGAYQPDDLAETYLHPHTVFTRSSTDL